MQDPSILDSFPNLYIWKKNIDLQFSYLNKSCAEVFGFDSAESALGKNDYDIPSDLAKFADIFRKNDCQVMLSKKKITFLEIQPCANREWKILHVVKQPYYEKNEIKGVLGYSIDITKSHIGLEQFIHSSKIYQNEDISTSLSSVPKLTVREFECLFFLLRRYTAKEIANFLKISFRTVEHHIEVLKSKFNAKSKPALLMSAKDLGFFDVIPQSIIKKQLSIIVE